MQVVQARHHLGARSQVPGQVAVEVDIREIQALPEAVGVGIGGAHIHQEAPEHVLAGAGHGKGGGPQGRATQAAVIARGQRDPPVLEESPGGVVVGIQGHQGREGLADPGEGAGRRLVQAGAFEIEAEDAVQGL